MTIAELDAQILHMIELEPTIPVQKLAKKVGTSWITANRHIKKLRNLGILSNPIAVFNPKSLGLERHIVLFRVTSEKQIENLEIACDIHPYTHYRTRIYGPFTGLFTQFDVPPSGHLNLEKFLDVLEEHNLCCEVLDMRSTGHRTSTHTNLQMFDSKSISWEYDWKKWSKIIEKSSPEVGDVEQETKTPFLDSVDLKILRELTSNANVSQGELQEKYSVSQSTVSRKMIAINNLYIESIRAQIDRSKFDVISTKLFYCNKPDPNNRRKLLNAFHSEDAPPFPLSIDLLENGAVFIWGRMPPSHEHELYYTLWNYVPELQVFTMDTVSNHSRLYWFYPENYDSVTRDWKTGYEWMVDAPLRALQEKGAY